MDAMKPGVLYHWPFVMGNNILIMCVVRLFGLLAQTPQMAMLSIQKTNLAIRTIESIPKSKKMGFDPDEVKAQLNSILTEVIQKLFERKS